MTRIVDEDYAYATARIRAVETRLLDQGKLDRMLDAASAEDSVKVLMDAQYGSGLGEPGNVSAYEQLLTEEMDKCYRLLTEIMPNPEIINLFRVRTDYLNAKILLKAGFQEKVAKDGLTAGGLISVEKLTKMIHDRSLSETPDIMRASIMDAIDQFSRSNDPQVIDLILDRAAFRQMKAEADEVGSEWLTELINYMIDAANIRVFVRGRLIEKSWDFFKRSLLEGGTIRPGIFSDFADKPVEAFVEAVRYTWFGESVAKGYDGFKTGRGISWLEKQLDDRLMSHIHGAKFVAMGIEPMVGYLFAKETEIRNVRIIMTGKINKIPQDVVRERLRIGYV